MKFLVDEMPRKDRIGADCPFSKWEPYPPFIEEAGRYICKLNDRDCSCNEKECRWLKLQEK